MHELTSKAFLHFRSGIIARSQDGHFFCLHQTAPIEKLGRNHLIELFLSSRRVHAGLAFDTAMRCVCNFSLFHSCSDHVERWEPTPTGNQTVSLSISLDEMENDHAGIQFTISYPKDALKERFYIKI